jgi:crossover junction endodeoxyribonuclease RuvC
LRILGIDPGYAIMGYGIVDRVGSSLRLVKYGAVTTDKDMKMPDRLKALYTELMEIIADYEPDEVSIEELYFNTNAKTVIYVGEARGVALLACSNSGLPIYEYTPLQIKTATTGNGRAEKKQMQLMVQRILGLDKIPKPDDAADAVAAAICHSRCGELQKKLYLMK